MISFPLCLLGGSSWFFLPINKYNFFFCFPLCLGGSFSTSCDLQLLYAYQSLCLRGKAVVISWSHVIDPTESKLLILQISWIWSHIYHLLPEFPIFVSIFSYQLTLSNLLNEFSLIWHHLFVLRLFFKHTYIRTFILIYWVTLNSGSLIFLQITHLSSYGVYHAWQPSFWLW